MLRIPTHYRVDDANVAWRVADQEAVLLHADSSAYFGLNQTGTLLWTQLAERPMTLEQLTTWAGSSFPDAPAGLPAEISTFVDQLRELELIQQEENGATPHAAPEAMGRSEVPPWEAPAVERFGELEKLILSGE